jgi:hypothetical protein
MYVAYETCKKYGTYDGTNYWEKALDQRDRIEGEIDRHYKSQAADGESNKKGGGRI